MNKQQLANKIWKSANQMRSKIEANEYKDYILGFMFYKFLSDQEEMFLEKNGATKEDIKLFKEHMKEGKGIKAAGGISSFEDAEKFIELGADRLGTSRLIKLM